MVLTDVSIGFNDSNNYLVFIEPKNVLLSDPGEYSERTEMGDRIYAALTELGAALLQRVGYTESEAADMMERAFALDAKLAADMLTSADRMSPDYYQRINNEMGLAEVAEAAGSFPMLRILEGMGLDGSERCLVTEPDYFKALQEVYTEENLADLVNYAIVETLITSANTLDYECHELTIQAYNSINGSEGDLPDDEAAYGVVSSYLTTSLNKAFLEKYDSTQLKEDITTICEEAIAYYRTMLGGIEWLSEETRTKAIEKLDAITINAVYPDKWRDYSDLDLNGLGYYECMDAISDFEYAYTLTLINGQVDREIWNLDILETNAYYNPSDNSINIIRGILGGVFYYEGMSEEELYAGIGCVIGHEISHAFDSSGAQFDAQGVLNNWWTEEDYEAFNRRTERLAEYYDNIVAFNGYHVPGTQVTTEAIADMAGVKCMLGILEEKNQEREVDFKAFFEAYATTWWRINTSEAEYFSLMQDTHPLHYLRVNATLQQFDRFLDIYGITEGDGMYLAPEDNVLVW